MRSREEALAYAEAWLAKLSAWEADPETNADIPAYPEAVRLFTELLDALPEARGAELAHAFAAAFKISEERVWEEVGKMREARYAPEPEAPASVLAPPPLTGLVARYVEWLREQESPGQYHAFSFLTAISAALERRGGFSMSGIRIYPNLYTILVGPSGARKDSAIDYAIDLVDEAVGGLNVLAGEGSQQGYAEQLAAREADTGMASGLICAPELKVLFGSDKYKAELVAWLTEWYKCAPGWSRVLRGSGELTLRNLYVCLLGGTTEEWLRKMPEDTLAGGFLQARALVIPATDKKHWRFLPGIDVSERNAIVAEVAAAFSSVPDEFHLSPSGEERMREWYEGELPKLAKTFDDRMQPFFQRIHVHALKFAAIDAVLRGEATLDGKAVESAVRLALWAGRAAQPLMAELEVREPIYDDVLRVVGKAGKPIPIRDVTRKLRNKYQARLLNDAMAQLIDTADLTTIAAAGGKLVTLGKGVKRRP